LTKNEYVDWRSSPATQEVFEEIKSRIEGLKEELAYVAGEDPRADGVKVGAIAAFTDILNTTYSEVTQDD
jgi:hypothetical protein